MKDGVPKAQRSFQYANVEINSWRKRWQKYTRGRRYRRVSRKNFDCEVQISQRIETGISHPTTVSPSSFITPYTPLSTDAEDAATILKGKEAIKIQLGAQIDGLGTIVCDTMIVGKKGGEVSGREADLMLATYYANELLLRLMMPPGLLTSGSEEEKKKAASQKPITQSKMTQLIEKLVKSYECNLVEGTTSWLFERNEIEGKKKIVLAPSENSKGEGTPELGDVWGVEMGVSLGTGKIKTLANRPTLHRRTIITYQLKRPSSRKTLSEIVKKFGTFPFSLRQLEDEREGKVGIVECVRNNVVRQYEVVSDKDSAPVGRLLTTIGEYFFLFESQESSLTSSSYYKKWHHPLRSASTTRCIEV